MSLLQCEHSSPLLMTAADDGSVRIWKNFLASSMKTDTSIHGSSAGSSKRDSWRSLDSDYDDDHAYFYGPYAPQNVSSSPSCASPNAVSLGEGPLLVTGWKALPGHQSCPTGPGLLARYQSY